MSQDNQATHAPQTSPSANNRQKVLGYPVDLLDEQSALDKIESAWHKENGQGAYMHVVTLNAEMVVASQKDKELDRVVRNANLVVPDGAGVVFALRLKGSQVNRLPGIELAHGALARAAGAGQEVALIGGRPEVMDKLVQVLPTMHPGLKICAHQNGFFKAEEEKALLEAISARKPKLVLVALGVPRQEFFIDRNKHLFPHSVLVGVGGSFDVWTGFVARAPQFFQRFHLEWLYRLLKEPWRFKRMAGSLPNFAIQVLLDRAKNKDDNAL
ncbi:MAG: WecB/TagA/CpsF family glycosyltransferase [Cyanobacteria bacterium SZAS LIN-2]|nr:WecB/TagA/CpsF family glycosyltransferase [Cyanobacteria bacterium SZAS LIN-2]